VARIISFLKYVATVSQMRKLYSVKWKTVMKDQAGKLRKEAIVTCSKVLFQHFRGGTEENY